MYNFYAIDLNILVKKDNFFYLKCLNTLRPKYVTGSKMFQYPHVVYYY